MKELVHTIDGRKYLIDTESHEIDKVLDYIELFESRLRMVSIFLGKKEAFYWGKNHVEYKKRWGCVDESDRVIVPFLFDDMVYDDGYIKAAIEKEGICFSHYQNYYFNLQGVPIIKPTGVLMFGWDWVEDPEDKRFSVAQKNGLQGVVKNDGYVFVKPQYKKVEINYDKKLINLLCEDGITIDLVFVKGIKEWRLLPIGWRFVDFTKGLYILSANNMQMAMDAEWNMVVPLLFDTIDVYQSYLKVTKKSKVGLLSRTKTFRLKGLQNPILAPLLKCEYDDISIKGNRAVIIKDSMQGVVDINCGRLLCPPLISTTYKIYPHTLSENAIAYTGNNQRGFLDLQGNVLFEIRIENDDILFCDLGLNGFNGFKNGKAIILGRKYVYVFRKDGSYERVVKENKNDKIYYNCNYDAERWDALTDGMEGDYPGSGMDYDLLGF